MKYTGWEIEKLVWGYLLKAPNPKGKYFLYVSKVHRDGTYSYTTDYTYAKYMTLKTAKKHLARLQEG